jgi:hypothetical protein
MPIVIDTQLATAINFAVLGASTITNTGNTVIAGGNLGLFPGTSVTGFPPGVFTPPAQEEIDNALASQAQIDANNAYVYFTTTVPAGTSESILDGLTLGPGTYTSGSSMALSGGQTLTLNGAGNYIFQIGSSLTVGVGATILLTGGATAANVIWLVGSSATVLGPGTTMVGDIIAHASVSLGGGTLNGRAFALTGAVTMAAAMAITAPPHSAPAIHHYLCASKEINGQIYITRMSVPAASDFAVGYAAGSDDGTWYFVGPGSRPSIQHYQGLTQFILTFDFMSHLVCRVVDINSWPPNVVNPIAQGSTAGPNTTNTWQPNTFYPTGSQIVVGSGPSAHVWQAGGAGAAGGNGGTSGAIMPSFSGSPQSDGTGNSAILWIDRGLRTAFVQAITSTNDALVAQLVGNSSHGTVDNYFNPPLIDRTLLFFDALTNTYSVTISLDPSFRPLLGVTPIYYRLYRRAINTLPWILVMDWTPTTFSYTDSSVGSLQYQYSATWGDQFNPANPGLQNAFQHAEGVPDGFLVTVNSSTEHPNAEFQVIETLTLKRTDTFSYMSVGTRQNFYVEEVSDFPDTILFSKAFIGSNSAPMQVSARTTFIPVVEVPLGTGSPPSAYTPEEILAAAGVGAFGSLSAPMQMH